ncbi:rhodanese-like domain-containing protein [Actinopolymorpha sp. B9G3]|uniref:rhodanese-like domain-containing protein n=1 Tax=Actinopolymorpha sp. B9G3 TaxID=3158970 RepID=UPI0032D98821
MTSVDVVPVIDEGLGNSTYLVDLGGGRALVVDASLDLRSTRRVAERRRLTLAFAAETHLHADFVSGAHQLAATDGTTVVASAAGNRDFRHTGLRDEEEVDLGGLRLRALATPGHTPEHVAFLLLDGDSPVGVFTGGSLLVGAAARTDLTSPGRTEALARQQYASLHRLAALRDDVQVWPTHGAGSFCSAPPGAQRTSTIGEEKATNPLLRAGDEDAFVTALLGSLGSFPPYFLRLAEVNRRGYELPPGEPQLRPFDVDAVRRLLAESAQVVDVRSVQEFAAGHIPGAVSIPLRPAFASWLGWLTSPDQSLVVVRGADQDPAEIAWQAAKIGYPNLAGELAGGVESWTAAAQPLARTTLLHADQLTNRTVLDIRQTSEFVSGHLPGATHVELGSLTAHADAVPGYSLVVMCGHGERAMGAASLLQRHGHADVAVLQGGPDDWAQATGRDLATGA